MPRFARRSALARTPYSTRSTRRKRLTRRTRRKKKQKTRYSKQTAKVKARVGYSAKQQSLRKRVAILEGVQKKHWDQSIPSDEVIHTFGSVIVGEPGPTYKGNSFRGMLAIQGRSQEGEIPDLSDVYKGTELNTRESEKVFITKVRLRGVILGHYPINWNVPEVSSGSNVYQPETAGLMAMSKTRVHMIILQDKKPNLELVAGGISANPLPDSNNTTVGGVANEGILENLFQWQMAAPFTNSLTTKGYGGALRRYEPSRFAPIFHKVFELSCMKPLEEFDVTWNVNKMFRYASAREGGAAQANRTQPLNANYVVMFCCQNQFPDPNQLPDGTTAVGSVLRTVRLQGMTSRTYFRDM